ncbi:hypothetical protein D3C72_1105290 [compost metagenome]
MDFVRVQLTGLDDMLDLGDGDLACHGAHRVEVARGAAEHQVAGLVGLVGLDQRHVGGQRTLHHVLLAVELADFLAVGHDRAHAGARKERRNAGAAGAQLLGQRALGREFEFQFAGQVLALELLVLAHVGRDHLPDLARGQQQAQAEAIDAGVVGDAGQLLGAAVAQRGNQRLGDAAQAETANGDCLAVADDACKRFCGAGVDLVHASLLPR